MARSGRLKLFCIVVLAVLSNLICESYGHRMKTLHITPHKQKRNIQVIEAPQSNVENYSAGDGYFSKHNLFKRSVTPESNITTNVSI